jgi:AcrR family transcriptional regulator
MIYRRGLRVVCQQRFTSVLQRLGTRAVGTRSSVKAIPPPAADARLDDQEGRDCGGHRSRDAARTRQRLLHTAARLFAANGYAATTVREIAHEADVNAALINRYFASKEGLFEACLTAGSHRIRPFADDGDEDDIATTSTRSPCAGRELVGVGMSRCLLLRSSGDDRAEQSGSTFSRTRRARQHWPAGRRRRRRTTTSRSTPGQPRDRHRSPAIPIWRSRTACLGNRR